MDWTDREILNVYCRPDVGDADTGYHPAPMMSADEMSGTAQTRKKLTWYEVFMLSAGKAMRKAGKTADEIKARWKEWIGKLKPGKTSGDPELDDAVEKER